MKPSTWSVAALLAIAAIVGVTAALNREIPLAADQVPPALLEQARWKHAPQRAWKELRFEADKTFVSAAGSTIESTVRYRIENVGNGLVRSTDDWYPRGAGQALVYEERYLLAANLFSLVGRYRETAPAFHAIFENEGWFQTQVVALALDEGPGAPGAAGWYLRGQLERQDGIASTAEGSRPNRLRRKFQCAAAADAKPNPARPTVECTSEDAGEGTRRRVFTYLPEAALFLPIGVEQKSPEGSLTQGTPRNVTLDGEPLAL